MTTLFISDLHLCGDRPAITDLFVQFLEERAVAAQALYILGDLFEHWVGDDALELPEQARAIEGLRRATDRGLPVHVLHGNRDFLLGERFARHTGCTVGAGPVRLDLYGTRCVLVHGDSLCTQDHEHQAWRRQVLDPRWQAGFLARDLDARLAIAGNLRQESETRKRGKSMEIMDVAQDAVEALMREEHVRCLIHGHTHRPAIHEFELDGAPARRIVLGDWYTQGSVLVCGPGAWQLESLPVTSGFSRRPAVR